MQTHKHHIIPKHMGGSDELSNLYVCTPAEHSELHFDLYLQHGFYEDFCAAYMLSGQAKSENMWGAVGIPRAKSVKKKISDARKKTGRYTGEAEQKWLKGAVKGGVTQGKKNAESGHLARISQINAEENKNKRAPVIAKMREAQSLPITHKERAKICELTYSQYQWYRQYLD